MKSGLWQGWRWKSVLLITSVFAITGFFLFSSRYGFSGFPLDDAWIHQVYARNLAERGEWAFNEGQPSGGSTSPLWSALMALGVIQGIPPVIWVGVIGCLTLFFSALFAEGIYRQWFPASSSNFPWVGLFFTLEWHLVWAAVSGMETSLFICLTLLGFFLLGSSNRRYLLIGLLAGLITWVRPDGITILGPVLFLEILSKVAFKKRLTHCLVIFGAFSLFFLPYLLFNLNLAGNIWPSTFSAKQTEYAAALGFPLLSRISSLFLPFLAGGGIVLFPGFIAAILFSLKRRDLEPLAGLLWVLGYLLMYALRLPASYQHGRYLMPSMAVFFLVGLWGMRVWVGHWITNRWLKLPRVFWATCLAAITLVFYLLGADAYANDVAIIETEMVAVARWVSRNIPPEKPVAAHDIGALGYFSNHEIIDLAGLVNPEIIPIMRDEKKLADYLDSRKIEYFVTFPGWYPELTRNLEPIFRSKGLFSPQAGGENMAVYRWR